MTDHQKKRIHKTIIRHRSEEAVNSMLMHCHLGLHSRFLKRNVNIDIFYPHKQDPENRRRTPTLFLNDGQDARQLRLQKTLTSRYRSNVKTDVVVVGIHAGDRINEYGTSGTPDYMGRGWKASQYTSFVLEELIPFVRKEYGFAIDASITAIAGFSLGGLSAMDIAWHHPEYFSRVGVFSGSFWWRKKGLDDHYKDSDRIMHEQIESGSHKPALEFWFEAGTNDEKSDRNNNGIIDSIDDTLDIMKSLKNAGYTDSSMTYVQIEGGEHNFHTWSEIFPEFLNWAFD
jgi:enterochelin esterase-like enzyme